MSEIYTTHAFFNVPGRGTNYMALFAYAQDETDALAQFTERAGPSARPMAKVSRGLVLDFQGATYLMSERLRQSLLMASGQQSFNFYASLFLAEDA
jgi:hypothetical protein